MDLVAFPRKNQEQRRAEAVLLLFRLLNDASTRELAQKHAAELDDGDVADLLELNCWAQLVLGGTGSALLESAAARLRGEAPQVPAEEEEQERVQ